MNYLVIIPFWLFKPIELSYEIKLILKIALVITLIQLPFKVMKSLLEDKGKNVRSIN